MSVGCQVRFLTGSHDATIAVKVVNFAAEISTLVATEMTCQSQDNAVGRADRMTELMPQLINLSPSRHHAEAGSVVVMAAPW